MRRLALIAVLMAGIKTWAKRLREIPRKRGWSWQGLAIILTTGFLGTQILLDRIASEHELSAYIWIEVDKVPIYNEGDKSWTFSYTLKNMGQTPARQVIIYRDYDIKPEDWEAPSVEIQSHKETFERSDFVAYLPREIPLPSTTVKFFVHDQPYANVADDVINSGSWLYMFGTIWFIDVYDKRRWLTYCFRYTGGKPVERCERGNDTGRH